MKIQNLNQWKYYSIRTKAGEVQDIEEPVVWGLYLVDSSRISVCLENTIPSLPQLLCVLWLGLNSL